MLRERERERERDRQSDTERETRPYVCHNLGEPATNSYILKL